MLSIRESSNLVTIKGILGQHCIGLTLDIDKHGINTQFQVRLFISSIDRNTLEVGIILKAIVFNQFLGSIKHELHSISANIGLAENSLRSGCDIRDDKLSRFCASQVDVTVFIRIYAVKLRRKGRLHMTDQMQFFATHNTIVHSTLQNRTVID